MIDFFSLCIGVRRVGRFITPKPTASVEKKIPQKQEMSHCQKYITLNMHSRQLTYDLSSIYIILNRVLNSL